MYLYSKYKYVYGCKKLYDSLEISKYLQWYATVQVVEQNILD